MSELVTSWLVFTSSPGPQLSDLIKRLQTDGWVTSGHDGKYHYHVGGQPKETESVEKLLTQVDSGATALIRLERNRTQIRIEKNADNGPPPELKNICIKSWESEFNPPREGWNELERDAATREYVGAVRTAVEEMEPNYGYGKYPEYVNPAAVPTYDDVLDGRVHGVFWLNVFGPKTTDRLGRDRIESTPAWLVEELESGHVLVVASDNPVRPSDEWEDAVTDVAAHLGIDRG